MPYDLELTLATEDPHCWITAQGTDADGTPWIKYWSEDGNRWIIRGKCNQCGECEVGTINRNIVWTGIPVGQAGACIDLDYGNRKDIPVRPEISKFCSSCTLRGEYL